MASNASTSASTSSQASSSVESSSAREQAGPLPTKRGEIGYTESLEVANDSGSTGPGQDNARNSSSGQNTTESNADPIAQNQSNEADASSTRKRPKPKAFLDVIPVFRGVQAGIIGRLVLVVFLLTGTIVAWVLSTSRLAGISNDDDDDDSSNSLSLSGSGVVFVHVAFGMAVLAQLVFLERTFYTFRGQRYNYLHPGEILPRHRRFGGSGSTSVALAPWNRPPIPTYAAALADSGIGTGDAEDNEIAIPPPPTYGNIRGSTMLLSGFIRNSLRREIEANTRRDSQGSQEDDRPISYISSDEEWDARCDAQRAITLEETLARLEDASQTTSRTADLPPQ